MIDSEVERLRRLRATALRVRAIARALESRAAASDVAALDRSACAAWRVARTASGRLRAHPFAEYQKDASLPVLIRNEMAAISARTRVSMGRDALDVLGTELQALARELADARALTWAPELSDAFGRSQAEIGGLLTALGIDSHAFIPGVLAHARIASATAAGDWPYLAL
jgi:hypothetical protein